MKALLVLEDGFSLEAESFTGDIETSGQVIFHTAMLGYQEIITDPALAGKFICFTYPLLGSCGVNLEDMESSKGQVSAVLCKEVCHPSQWQMHCSLPDFLKEQGIPGLQGVNTRALTKHLRQNGSLRAAISTSNFDVKALQTLASNFKYLKDTTNPYSYTNGKKHSLNWQPGQTYAWAGNKPRLLVFDLGISNSLLQILEQQGFEILVSPVCSAADVHKSAAQAVFISDGSGAPNSYAAEIEILKQINLPMAGVRLGHLLLGQALGAKLIPCNHHGNYPVQNIITNKVEVAGQNHCFALNLAGSDQLRCTHLNLHDNTVEGFVSTKQSICAVQHYNTPAHAEVDSFFKDFYQLVQTHN